MFPVKRYIGRQLRPSQLAAELLPADQLWCTVCHKVVEKRDFAVHRRSLPHRLGQKKLKKLKVVSLQMWEQHRGAPVSQESAREDDIAAEFRRFRQDQRRREAVSASAQAHPDSSQSW